MSWTKETFERLFHWSNITYIANAFDEDIWIGFKSNDLELETAHIGQDISESQGTLPFSLRLNKISEVGWIKLKSGNVHKHNRSSKTERITIVCTKELKKALVAVDTISADASNTTTEDTNLIMVLNYQIQQNYSYIMTKNGEFLQQKYGSNNFFRDFLGKDHHVKQTNSNTSDTNQNETQTNFEISDTNQNETQTNFEISDTNQNETQTNFEISDTNQNETQTNSDISRTAPEISAFLSTLLYFSALIGGPLCVFVLALHIK
ncbi:hypothetical protein I4U23_017231 [Adineta vaga]|nr:hypothetical protein I4U23_017231 [Adineta vaga]